MSAHPQHICIATLGGQPQIVTLTLDRLLARGYPIEEVIVVHLAPTNPRYQAALDRLAGEFQHDQYGPRAIACRYRPHLIQAYGKAVTDLDTDAAIEAVRNTFHVLLLQLKQQGATIHICISGGRRLLGYLALSLAPLVLRDQDGIWQLLSSDAVRAQTRDGAIMHLDDHPDIHLIRLPTLTLGQYLVLSPHQVRTADALTTQSRQRLDSREHARCRQVWNKLNNRPRAVLRLIAQGYNPTDTADQLTIAASTVSTHLNGIYAECRNAWDLAPETRIDYHWLREHFAEFLAEEA